MENDKNGTLISQALKLCDEFLVINSSLCCHLAIVLSSERVEIWPMTLTNSCIIHVSGGAIAEMVIITWIIDNFSLI